MRSSREAGGVRGMLERPASMGSARSFYSVEEKHLSEVGYFSPAIAHWRALESIKASSAAPPSPESWSLNAAVLFVDISGFTNLCTRLDIDRLQKHINQYFTSLIDVVNSFDGDVLRFAGDALLCAWFVPLAAPADHLAVIACTACRCGQQLLHDCGTYNIQELDATLSIHCGVGAGRVDVFRVGSAERWELFVAGDPMRQVAMAEGCSKLGEIVISREAWELVKGACDGEPRGELGNMLLKDARAACAADTEALEESLLSRDVIRLQRDGSIHLLLEHDAHESYLAELRGFVHETARRALDLDALHELAERRSVVVCFSMIEGLALGSGDVSGLEPAQRCLATALEAIGAVGGLLRQFILDDKGMVLIWTFGLPQNSYEDNATRGLQSCVDLAHALSTRHQLRTRTGITSGVAFCGLVGSHYRHEFSVMGPSVNLAARLMCLCEAEDATLLCNDELHELVLAGRSSETRSFAFHAHPPIEVKGYTDRVTYFRVDVDARRNTARATLVSMDIWNCLSPNEQLIFLDAMREASYAAGAQIVKQGEHGESFYVIITGSVDVTRKEDPKGEQGEEEVFLRRLGRGQHFGELALHGDTLRSATVTACEAVTCLLIDRERFNALFGSLTHLLRRKYRDQQQSPLGHSPPMVGRRSQSADAGSGWDGSDRGGGSGGGALSTSSPLGLRGAAPASPGLPPSRRLRQILERCGRKAEGGLLSRRVEAVGLTREPTVTVVSGEPGIGKSHLLQEVHKALYVHGSQQYGHGSQSVACFLVAEPPRRPLGVWITVVRKLAAARLDVPAEQLTAEEVRPLLPTALLEASSEKTLEGLLGGRRRRASEGLGGQQHPDGPALRAELGVLVALLQALIGDAPHLLLLDGVEAWCELSWQALSLFLAEAPPVAVVLAARDLSASERASLDGMQTSPPQAAETCAITATIAVTHMTLLPIGEKATLQILSTALGDGAVTPELTRKVHDRCGGVPAFVLALLEQLPSATAESLLESVHTLPRRWEDLVLSQLDRLPFVEQAVVKAASVVGMRVDLAALRGIWPGAVSEIDDALSSSSLRHYLVPVAGEAGTLSFRNAAVFEIIYGLMLTAQRQRLHGLLAHWYKRLLLIHQDEGLHVSLLAFHAERSGDALMAKRSLMAAGRVAVQRGLYSEAASAFSRAHRHFDEAERAAADPLYVQATVALVEMASRFGTPLPDGASPTDTLRRLLTTIASRVNPSWADHATASPSDERAPPFPTRSPSRRLRDLEGVLAHAQTCHSFGWALIKETPSEKEGGAALRLHDKAVEDRFLEAVRLRKRASCPELAAESLNGLATCYHNQAKRASSTDPDAAKALYKRAGDAIDEALALRPHWDAAQCLTTAATLYFDPGSPWQSLQQAISCAALATGLYIAELGPFHVRLVHVLRLRASAYEELRRPDAFECALSLRSRIKRLLNASQTLPTTAASGSIPQMEQREQPAPLRRWRSSSTMLLVPDQDDDVPARRERWLEGLIVRERGEGENEGDGGGHGGDIRERLLEFYPELGSQFVGLTLERDGHLVDGALELREATLCTMQLAIELAAGTTRDALTGLAGACLTSAEALDDLLVMSLLSAYRHVALLADACGSEIDELTPPSFDALLHLHLSAASSSSPPPPSPSPTRSSRLVEGGELPTLARLSSHPDRQKRIGAMLNAEALLDLHSFCAGEAVAGQGLGASIRQLEAAIGGAAAKLATLHAALRAYAAMRLLAPSTSPAEDKGVVDRLSCALASVGAAAEASSPAAELRIFFESVCDGETPSGVAGARLYCMLGGGGAETHAMIATARQLVEPAELEALEAELCSGQLERAPDRIVRLQGASDLLRACIKSKSRRPSATPSIDDDDDGDDDGNGDGDGDAASACAVALRCLHQLYRLARICLRQSALEVEAMPWVVDCINVVRVVTAGGVAALRHVAFCVLRCTAERGYIVIDKKHEVLRELQLDANADEETSLAGLEFQISEAAAEADDGLVKDEPPTKLIMICDPGLGHDVGKELALILCRALQDLELVELNGVVANYAPATERARLVRGTLDALGLQGVPVAVGTNGGVVTPPATSTTPPVAAAAPAAASLPDHEPDEPDGGAMLLRLYEAAADASLTLLLTSSLTDAAAFISEHEGLFQRKTARVVVMAGVADGCMRGESEFILPDLSAANCACDLHAAEMVYRRCQELHVTTFTLCRSAVEAASLRAFVYDELAMVGHPVASRLRESQVRTFDELWRKASLPPGHEGRRPLPERCDQAWFCSKFCGGVDHLESVKSAATAGRGVWPYVSDIYAYDALALLAVHPKTLGAFFEVQVKLVHGTEHFVVGATSARPGVRDPNALRSFLRDALRRTLAETREAARTPPAAAAPIS